MWYYAGLQFRGSSVILDGIRGGLQEMEIMGNLRHLGPIRAHHCVDSSANRRSHGRF